uniref:MATH domain-containing protein n=1 Tax=Hordeum vulgare subsp. vulgare TaxID=112509 RepID=A0A8I6WWU4_HORVV
MSNSRASSRGASGGVAVTPSMSASSIVAKAASGSHVLKIDGYSRTKGLGCGKFITSRSFVVGGHCWCLRYYPDSDDESMFHNRWISILLCLDPSEAGEVRAQFKISLLDKEGHPVPRYVWNNDTCFTFSGKREPPVSGLFIEKAELESLPYLKDDCFSVRCDITVVMEIVTEDLVVPAVERGIKKETF